MGLASWIGRISSQDAALVQMLRKAGAIIYTRKTPKIPTVQFTDALTLLRNKRADDADDVRNY